MKKTNKKGFTIVELVIVIAVIAILSAVLIPTFSGIVKKARLSADQQAVRQMNTAIATYEDGLNIADLKALLSEDNIDANNYKPLTKGAEFFWTGKQIVMVEGNKVIYPEDAKGDANKNAWQSLSGEGNKAVAELLANSGVLTENINMQGGSLNIVATDGYKLGGTNASNPVEIKNVVSDEGSKRNASGDFAETNYGAGLIATVSGSVVVENLVIDGAIVGDTTGKQSAYAGIIAGEVAQGATLTIRNVTIKNSTVFASFRVGALVGYNKGNVIVENVKFENVTVKANTIGAKLIGHVWTYKGATAKFTDISGADTIKMVALSSGTTKTQDGGTLVKIGDTFYPQITTEYCWSQVITGWGDGNYIGTSVAEVKKAA